MKLASTLARTRVKLLLAVGTAIAVLAACSPQVPQVDPKLTLDQPVQVVTVAQLEKVLDAVAGNLSAAEDAKDGQLLSGRVTGPGLVLRQADFNVHAANAEIALPPLSVTDPLISDPQPAMISSDPEFARSVFVFTQASADAGGKRLLLLTQTEARSNYQLWGWTRLLPGVELTQLPALSEPVATVAPNSADLVTAPDAVVDAYVDVLNKGANSEFAEQFEEDSFRQQLAEIQQALAESLAAAKGTRTMTFVRAESPVVGMYTTDGGAILMAELSSLETMTVPAGATLSTSPRVQALLGATKITTELQVTYTNVIAFYVPPAGSADPTIKVIGVEHSATAATGK